jgi:hypothetical protein
MTDRNALLQEIDTLPPEYMGEVIDFVSYLKHKKRTEIPETMLHSEAALAKDWDNPEEDAAWADL